MQTFSLWKQRHASRSPYRQAQIALHGLIRTHDRENRDVARINGEINAILQHSSSSADSLHI